MPAPTADYVNLQYPSSFSAATGEATTLIYGRVYEPGVTEAAGPSTMVIAQLGYGPAGSDPTTSSDWIWVDATFGTQIGSEDEYQASLTIPTAGTYAYTYRFAIDDGVNPVVFTCGDLDGAGTASSSGFDPSQLGTVTVTGEDAHSLVLGDRVFFDSNSDGVYVDGQDSGINGVSLSLFLDANGDNLADGAAIATTITAADGVYSFTGLAPGNYIVGVDASNFQLGGALQGLASASASSDPDDDVDNDDNGVNGSGGAVISNSITLAYGSETAADGTGGLNVNDTLDFGFIQAPNTEPAGAENGITIDEDGSHLFSASDFGFSDSDGNSFAGINVITIPANGELLLNGVAVVPAPGGVFVSAADIAAGNLVYVPDANENGVGMDSFTFAVRDDGGTDNGGEDTDQTPNTITFDVTPVNDAPTIEFSLPLIPDGPRTLVNTTTASDQQRPAVTTLPDGGYVVTWESSGQDGSDWGLYVQRFDASGAAVGSEVQVNTTTDNIQAYSSVTALDDGGFIVAWHSREQDGEGYGIYVQQFDASGAAVGAETRVNSFTTGDQSLPSIAGLPDGGYIVTWSSSGQDSSFTGVYAQRYDSSGAPVGGETLVNTTTFSSQNRPSIATFPDGSYIIAWDGRGTGDLEGIYAQRYDASGMPVGGETQVNTTTDNNQHGATVTVLSDGGYAIAWNSYSSTSGWDVHVQRFDANGEPVGGESVTDTTAPDNQSNPSIAALPDGGYIVAWSSAGPSGNGIFAQQYDATGTPVGGEVQLSTYAPDPALAALPGGGYVAVWASINQDGSGYGVYAQRYVPGYGATEQISQDLKGTIELGDVDAGAGEISLILSVDYGVLTVSAGGSGAAVTGSGTGSVTVTGTLAQIQALLGSDATSQLSYTADTDAPPASAELTVTVDDGSDETSATQAIVINAVNDNPVASDDSLVGVEDQVVIYTAAAVIANDSDPDGDPLALQNVFASVRDESGVIVGSVSLNGDGTITFTPTANFNGTASFDYIVRDGSGRTDIGTAQINVGSVNDAPEAVGDSLAAIEDQAVTYAAADLVGNDSDVDGDTLVIDSVSNAAGGSVVVNDDGTVTFTSAANFNGAASFDYVVSDGNGGTDTGSVMVNVTAVNDAPTLSGTAPLNGVTEASVATNSGETARVNLFTGVSIADLDSTTMTGATVSISSGFQAGDFLSIGGATSGTISGTTISYSYDGASGVMTLTGAGTLDQYESALQSVQFSASGDNPTAYGTAPTRTISASVTDGAVASNAINATVHVTGINDAPVNTVGAALNFFEDTIGSATPGNPVNAISGLSISDLDADPATDGFTVTLLVDAGTLAIRTDVINGLSAAQIVGNGTSTLTLTGTIEEINATLGASNASNQPNGVVYTPPADYNGTATLTVLTDDQGNNGNDLGIPPPTSEQDSDSLTINIGAYNDAPVVAGDGTEAAATILEDTPFTSADAPTVATLFGGQFSDAADAQYNASGNPSGSAANTLAGVAIVANGSSAETGQWQYLVGSTWLNVGSVSQVDALMLAAGTQLRFNPAEDYNGPAPTLTVHLVDNSQGPVSTGTAWDLTVTGGSTRYSAETVVLSQTVTAVNDAPVISNLDGDTVTYFEDGAAVRIDDRSAPELAASLADDQANFNGGSLTVSITGNEVASEDVLSIYTLGGIGDFQLSDGTNVGSVVSVGVLRIGTITSDGRDGNDLVIEFDSDNATAANVSTLIQALSYYNGNDADPSTGARTISVTLDDGLSGSDTATVTVNVAASNDAPVLTVSHSTLGNVAEDSGAPSGAVGTPLTEVIGLASVPEGFDNVTDPDGPAVGIAVTGIDTANGTLWYSTDGGVSWTLVPEVSESSALLLAGDANTRLYFQPDANFSGSAFDVITFRAWDGSAGASGDTGVDTTSNGGSSAFSTETDSLSITVTEVNDAPSGADNSVTTSEDDGYTFTAADFGFSDGDGNGFAGVVITTLPPQGTLLLNGTAIAAGAFVSAADIAGGDLVFAPDPDEFAAPYASFTFQVRDDGATADGGVDTDQTPNTITIDVTVDPITGTTGNDTLEGSARDDVIDGGEGDDTLEGYEGDDLLDGGNGTDTATYAGAASGVTVNLGTSGPQNTGGAGNDTLESIENLTGSDFADSLTGDAGGNRIEGGSGHDLLEGKAGEDSLIGGAGNDTLDGGADSDVLTGGLGNDRYEINSAGDVIIEVDGEGEDRLLTKTSYTLAPGASVEILGTTNQQATDPIDITGNEFGQRIYGNAGSNVLDGGGGDDMIKGGAGADTMIGGTGNDRFHVNDANDVVVEAVGEGSDWVQTKVSYALAEGAAVETLSTTNASSTAAIDLTGNEFKNSLHGNAGANVLDGGDGDDRLFGLGGADTLIGGAGADALKGGAGNDRFVLNSESESTADAFDRILDFASGDLIDLGNIDANVGVADDQAFALVGSAEFTGTAGELRYEQIGGNTFVEGDTDGDGIADFTIRIDGLHTLESGDFVL